MNRFKTLLCAAALAALPLAATAAGSEEKAPAAAAQDPDFKAGVEAWKAKNWTQVSARMQAVVQREPNNADAWNYLGHAARQSGDLQAAFRHYDRALAIDPRHRGAHEYAGEAWLMAGNPTRAEEHLKALDKLCTLPCEEYTDLKKAIAEYRRKNPS